MRLFDDITRTDSRRAKRTESLFAFLNRATGAEHEVVRVLMDEWFDWFPAEGRADLRERFRSDDVGQHLGAFSGAAGGCPGRRGTSVTAVPV